MMPATKPCLGDRGRPDDCLEEEPALPDGLAGGVAHLHAHLAVLVFGWQLEGHLLVELDHVRVQLERLQGGGALRVREEVQG